LRKPSRYIPIDISGSYLHAVAEELARDYPGLTVQPIVADFTQPLFLGGQRSQSRRIGFFPRSALRTFVHDDAGGFLARAGHLLQGGGFLVGVDLVKDPVTLHRAYNDLEGVTAAFNKNVLLRANEELEATFDSDKFSHYAFYNPLQRRVEMHL